MENLYLDQETRPGLVWYLNAGDPDASKPADVHVANWWGHGPAAAEYMLDTLERLIRRRLTGLASAHLLHSTSRRLPRVTIVIDHCHDLWWDASADTMRRWESLARTARKAHVRIKARTDRPCLRSFGGSATLRDLAWDHTGDNTLTRAAS